MSSNLELSSAKYFFACETLMTVSSDLESTQDLPNTLENGDSELSFITKTLKPSLSLLASYCSPTYLFPPVPRAEKYVDIDFITLHHHLAYNLGYPSFGKTLPINGERHEDLNSIFCTTQDSARLLL